MESTSSLIVSGKKNLHLFEGYGIELEYMIVDKETLQVLPKTDVVIYKVTNTYTGDADLGEIGWSNELVLHVIELKTNGPAKSLTGLSDVFHQHVLKVNDILNEMGAQLMPTAMHPWMDPHAEMHLWPHDNSPIYDAYDRIFNCKGHGWANLQSTHINLPFYDDEEFGRLHAAVRLVLPLIPAIAASSPIADGAHSDYLDYRLEVYRHNQSNVPSIAGKIIPEAVYSKEAYDSHILKLVYEDIAPHDPDGILQEEWLNSRGAIARFERNTIEIRLVDIQECPLADLAIAALIVEVIRALVEEKWISYEDQKLFNEDDLSYILLDCIRAGEKSTIHHRNYLQAFGLTGDEITTKALWAYLIKEVMTKDEHGEWLAALNHIIEQGTLATRIIYALNNDLSRESMKRVYGSLCECLAQNKLFSSNV